MIKLRHIFSLVSSFGLTLLLSGCQMVVLQPKGVIAADEKDLLINAILLMLIVVIPVILLTVVIAHRYRASNKKAKYSPEFTHSAKLEAIWWSIPCIIIGTLAYITWVTTHQLDPYRPLDKQEVAGSSAKPINIQAISLRWKWLFIYPDLGIATVNYVTFPEKTPVNFRITSDAPMNSFQIQQLAGQIYAMNGMQTKLHLIADSTGSYPARSVSFSGDGFSDMQFKATSTTQADFEKWIASVKKSPHALTMATYNQLVEPSENNPPEFFSSVKEGLFQDVMMKFMMPMSTTQPAPAHFVPAHL